MMSTPTSRWIFLCRHGAEDALQAELARAGVGPIATLCSGAVEAVLPPWPTDSEAQRAQLRALDPAWALQVLPAVHTVPPLPTRRQAAAIADVLAVALEGADAFSLHALLPGDLRGNPQPPGAGRRALLLTALAERMTAIRRRMWRSRRPDDDAEAPLRVQLLLDADGRGPEGGGALVSVAPAQRLASGGIWPSASPAGRLAVADDPAAPASSFRKLEEAFGLLGCWPRRGDVALDLGAAPGGWTRVLRRYGARVLAVDRAKLAPALLADPGVRHCVGDAFRFDAGAELPAGVRLDWLVSDIVAFPERIVELLGALDRPDRFGPAGPPRFVVVQMKFRGAPDLAAVDAGIAAARACGYVPRARHLHHDKNEVTIVARHRDVALGADVDGPMVAPDGART